MFLRVLRGSFLSLVAAPLRYVLCGVFFFSASLRLSILRLRPGGARRYAGNDSSSIRWTSSSLLRRLRTSFSSPS
uniref:Uncharacterized protein n=1 Tax=Candidatus Kentrum sp. FM TaxID=2126340 RepID=A0A450S9A2_9GAMM|nr:MAG: hypothetical protein BECKFM1743A_GA0114220_100613 [Candidatus Kentron sp. FM]VFJ48940.1 MAG: hypothetical protein BECKFM1743C_GA0114222_100653 [Candidatus Kentron sp. FM]